MKPLERGNPPWSVGVAPRRSVNDLADSLFVTATL